MSDPHYRLPSNLAEDIDAYEQDVQRFLVGELPGGVLKAKRVPRGVYEQRQDGIYMVRVRVAGGALTTPQARELAVLSREFGNGVLHVTTRQDVQLHDIPIGDTPGIMRRLMAVGLTSKGGGGNTVRNVAACPYAGICPHECFDVTPFAHAVTEYLIPLVGSYNLPRKYKIAFSGCAADCAFAQVADLGLVAEVRDGQPGFRVLAGGGMGARSRIADPFFDWIPASDVVRMAEAVRRLFDRHGDRTNKHRARLRFAFERLGVDAMREECGVLLADLRGEEVPDCEVAVAVRSPVSAGPPVVPPVEQANGVRYFRQHQPDRVAVPLHLPLGFVSADDFELIAELAGRFSEENGVRTSRRQNLLIRSVPADRLSDLADALGELEPDLLGERPLEHFVACAGASTCRLGLCMARGLARAGAGALAQTGIEADTLAAMPVYINGCPNACGHQPVGAVGLSGAAQRADGRLAPAYRVTLGGYSDARGARLGRHAGQVPAKAVPTFLAELAADFASGRDPAEDFPAYVDRCGAAHFEAIVAKHAALPDYSENPDAYRDYGMSEDFSLAGRGAGECGAGVFEVIREDLAAAEKADEPFATLVPAARALLITRGVDTRDPDSVLREFEKHFVDSGLVDDGFRALLSRGRGHAQGWQQAFEGHEEAVGALLERVKLLYSTLDASLEFHPPEPAVGGPGEGSAAEVSDSAELDLRGVACPMNFVKAKLRLEGMNVGETLAVLLDDGEPGQNVPASFRNEGQSIEASADLGNGHWRVVVRKEH
jgi:sulfite reductase (ferredoxin)